jgi:hypothetical protein
VPRNDYRFVTRWRVEGTADEVYRVLDNPPDFARWWPAVWLHVDVVDAGDQAGVGRFVRFTSKGWLPYVLHWNARTVEKHPPHTLVIKAFGDFEGEGRWSLKQDGLFVDVQYIWSIEANKPLLRYLSFLLRPLFEANHRWAMARGEESLRLELARRRAPEEQQARLPPPPQPTFVRGRHRG